jgi:hypothetical protein
LYYIIKLGGFIMFRELLLSLLFIVTISNATIPTETLVAKLYIATFDRAPDNSGLHYWLNSGLALEQIAMSFFDQEETKDRYPDSSTTPYFIQSIYKNLFDREVDTNGFEYWLSAIETKEISRSLFILAVMNGALGDDAILLNKKSVAGLKFANEGGSDIDQAYRVIDEITKDENSDISTIGTTYYVSNSGDDTNSGTLEEKPWRSISKVNREIANKTFLSGDKILFRRGDIWSENNDNRLLYIKDLTPDINPSNPIHKTAITFGAYGVGIEPELHGNIEMVRIYNSSNIVLENLRIIGENRDGSIGVSIYFDYSQSGENSDTSPITHSNYITLDNLYIDRMDQGMVLSGRYITLKNSTIKNTNDGSSTNGSNGVYVNSGADYLTIENNIFDNNSNAGKNSHHLYIASGENGVIKDNLFIDSDPSTTAGAGLQFHAETWYSPIQNWLISGNTFRDNRGMAIQLQPECYGAGEPYRQIISNITIEKNLFENNEYLMQLEGNKNITFQNNIIMGNQNYVSFAITNECADKRVDNLIIQNNTFYNNNNNRIISWEDEGGNFIFQNNIVYEEILSKDIIYRDANPSSEIYRNNIYYIPNYSKEIIDSNSIDYGSTIPSPLFVNVGVDFHLQSNSVAIDRGFANGLIDDYSGSSRKDRLGVDIGAFEYQ